MQMSASFALRGQAKQSGSKLLPSSERKRGSLSCRLPDEDTQVVWSRTGIYHHARITRPSLAEQAKVAVAETSNYAKLRQECLHTGYTGREVPLSAVWVWSISLLWHNGTMLFQ